LEKPWVNPEDTHKLRRKVLSNFFGEPVGILFEGEDELSALGLQILKARVCLPGGYRATRSFRVPKIGEFFLSVKALNEDRVVVYKATGPCSSPELILDANFAFDLNKCYGADEGKALYKGRKVEVLQRRFDDQGMVPIMDRETFRLVDASQLRNLRKGRTGKKKLTLKNRLLWKPNEKGTL
jgi:hypothetical protein